MKKLILLPALFFVQFAFAQLNIDTLAFQDFELAPASPVWTFTGPVIYNSGYSSAGSAPANSPLGIGGSRAWETTVNSGGLQLEFSNIAIPAGYDSIRVRFNLAAMCLTSTSGGPDDLDWVLASYSTDGGVNYFNRIRIRGAVNNNSYWPYSATGYAKNYYQPATEQVFQPVNTGPQTTLGYSTVEIVFPGNLTQIKFRITARSSSSTDTWLVDNLVMTGENNCASSASTINPVACQSYTAPSGTLHTSSGTFTDIIPNANGCDSVITVNLTILNASTSSINPVVCGMYISPAGNLHTSSAVFTDTLANVNGCDSLITVNLTVYNATSSTINPVTCGAYTSPAGNIYTVSGNYLDTLINSNGCDSLISVNLTVNVVDTSTSVSGITITAGASGAQYQWIDCDNSNMPIAGATSQSFTPVVNGNYAVIVTENSCTDTSSCVSMLSLGVDVTTGYPGLHVYPNPVENVLIISFDHTCAVAEIRVSGMNGQLVLQQEITAMQTIALSLEKLESGVYFLTIIENENVRVVKVVKE
jgi:hypothetical protein